ncbi:hypothetical protein CAL7716_081430 [Calothrix sp. PCC 7716]|nr:hypothetical protein CAL7716_081430 [Calothrix sp. PCC 7716]
MSTLMEALYILDELIHKKSPELARRLQAGLTRTKIDEQIKDFSWTLPEELYEFYQWHNGLCSQVNATGHSIESLKIKDKWQSDLSQPNQINVKYDNNLIAIKFPSLEYALAGHHHLKLGQCPLDLLPIFTCSNGKNQSYCIVNLEREKFATYFLNGTKLHPTKINEQFLSTQIKFNSLTDLILFITSCCEHAVESSQEVDSTVFELDKNIFERA